MIVVVPTVDGSGVRTCTPANGDNKIDLNIRMIWHWAKNKGRKMDQTFSRPARLLPSMVTLKTTTDASSNTPPNLGDG